MVMEDLMHSLWMGRNTKHSWYELPVHPSKMLSIVASKEDNFVQDITAHQVAMTSA